MDNNATRDDDSVINRVENSNTDDPATTKRGAMLKDGGSESSESGTESVNSTEKGSSSSSKQTKGGSFIVDTMDKGGSIAKDIGGSITKDGGVCVDIDITVGGEKAGSLELVCPPASSKSRSTTARSEWGEDIKNDVAVRMKWVILSIDGTSFHCYLCDKTVKARWNYSPDSYMGKTGHIHTDKHQKELDTKLWNIRRQKQRIADGKQPEKEVKNFAQSTMMGFFRRGSTTSRTSTSRSTTSQSTSSSTSTIQSTTSRTSSSSATAGKFYYLYLC